MSWQEAESEYLKAMKQGQKEVAALRAKGENPYPAVLDDLLDDKLMDITQYVGVMDIPADRVVGTKSAGRQAAFSAGFQPLLEEYSEFAVKWIRLCSDHLGEEGIRDPIKCYEYLGNFYVQEGNKRLSVLRHFDATYVSSSVYRILPEKEDTVQYRVYNEFLDFFRCAKTYDVLFTQPGSYAKLLKHMGLDPETEWTEEQRRKFRAYCMYFREAFDALGGKNLKITAGDAMLLWLQVHPYSDLGQLSTAQLKKSLSELWENVVSLDEPEPTFRTEAPDTDGKYGLLGKMIRPSHVNVAFVHQRTTKTSPWTNAHDVGRQHLEEALGSAVTVRSYFEADTPEQAEAVLELAVKEGAEVVFSTTPQLIEPSLKVSVNHPKVRFLNCSVHMPYSTVHTYYSRIYEGKFITGAIAGAIADNNHIGYVGSYPIYGVPASINAFALGAQMTNPRATIDLKWSCLPGNPTQEFLDEGIWVVSNRDNPVGDKLFTEYGTYSFDEEGNCVPLGSPTWVWGKFYEKVVRSILSGTWDSKRGQAVNDWWGFSSGVIDVTLAEDIPEGVKALAEFLKEGLRTGTIDPFKRKLVDQNGVVRNDGTRSLSAEELLHMDWLCSNIHGTIPKFEELLPISRPTVRLLGVHRDDIPVE